MNEKRLLAILGSPHTSGTTAAMLNYAIRRAEEMDMNIEQTKEVFITLAMFVHGYASIIANNSLEYDEKLIEKHLERVYTGAILAIQEEIK